MQHLLDDPISLIVAFTKGKVKPWKLKWGQKIYDIKRVNLITGSREGRSKIFFFNVSDDDHAWKLRFNTDTLEWRLVEAYTP
ncbi:hypothetical protein EPN90_02270 [Patescibacteria group bacterium]|nr:MAG: hypothetical protein EPN90_02270 [Patescibacteria group bacterium]